MTWAQYHMVLLYLIRVFNYAPIFHPENVNPACWARPACHAHMLELMDQKEI